MEAVAITGASGTLGRALLARLTGTDVQVRACSRSEKAQLDLRGRYPDVDFRIGDVQDRAFVRGFVDGCDVVIHGAALKHVNLSEAEPTEYVKVNVVGSLVVAEEAAAAGAKAVGISTDKACYPIANVYGHTKLLMERIFCELGHVCVRYGNVLGSAGSVLELWDRQLGAGDPLTVTDPAMSRFYFRVEDAVDEVLWAVGNAPAGTVVVPRLRSVRMRDLACAFLQARAAAGATVPLDVIGPRPGERKHEWLLSDDEGDRSRKLSGRYVFSPSGEASGEIVGYGSERAHQIPFEELVEWLRLQSRRAA